MLEASALGLGNVWVGAFDPAVIKAEFPETAGYEVVCLFPVGVADAGPGANHEKRQTKEQFVSEI
jgi:nitroreductase